MLYIKYVTKNDMIQQGLVECRFDQNEAANIYSPEGRSLLITQWRHQELWEVNEHDEGVIYQ